MGSVQAADDRRFLNVLITVGYGVIPLSYIGLLALGPTSASQIAREDGPIESLGAILALLASISLLVAYARSSGHTNRFLWWPTRKNVWLLLLAGLLFFWCGEEISWGQRIFGWSTPSFLSPLNVQDETNLHNLSLFNLRDADGTLKTGLALMLTFNRLLNVFWLTFFVVVPLLNCSLGIARNALAWFGVPVPALAIGLLFPANYVGGLLSGKLVARYVVAESQEMFQHAIHELFETNCAFFFALFGVWLLFTFPRALEARGIESDVPLFPGLLPEPDPSSGNSRRHFESHSGRKGNSPG